MTNLTTMSAPKILAISSGGGHWTQLLRLQPALAGCRVLYATTHPADSADVPSSRFLTIPDCNRWTPTAMLACIYHTAKLLLAERPDVILSTGAAPGCIACLLGKIICRARVIWIDSIANAGCLSCSGRIVGPTADLWLTQWPRLAEPGGPCFVGRVF